MISQAYGLWLQFEVRTDDITLIVAFVDMEGEDGRAPRAAPADEVAMYAERRSVVMQEPTGGLSSSMARIHDAEFKPVRRGNSKCEVGSRVQFNPVH